MPNYPYSFQLPPLNVQDIPNNGAVGEFLGISAGGVLDWLPVASGGGDMLKSENLSGLASYPTARTNLGLGLTDSPTFKNLVISTGSIATSAPVTISQTWDALAVEFTAFKVNATSTNSAAGSLLLDLQVGGVSYVKIGRNGLISVADSVGSGGFVFRPGNTQSGGIGYLSGGGYGVWAGAGAAIGFSTGAALIGSIQTALYTDGAGQLALRNGAAAQTFRVYNTYTDASNYTRGQFEWSGGTFYVSTANAGTGVAAPLGFWVAGGERMRVLANGNVGIGTTAPAAKLDVVGDSRVSAGSFNVDRTGGNFSAVIQMRARAAGDGSYFASAVGNGAGEIISLGLSGLLIGSINAVPLVLGTNNLERLRIDSAGNVGIGTTAPSSKLHVEGGTSPTITLKNTSATGYGQLLFQNTVVSGTGFWLNGSTQTGYGGANSLNAYSSDGPIAFHTASVTNALSIAQSGAATFAGNLNLPSNASILSNSVNYITYNGTTLRFWTAAQNATVNINANTSTFSGSSNTLTLNPGGTTSNYTFTSDDRLQLGGSSDSYPALKRSTTRIQAVLATTSATFTNIQGKLTTDTDYTATVVTPTGFLTLYDAQGTAYRVPCVAA